MSKIFENGQKGQQVVKDGKNRLKRYILELKPRDFGRFSCGLSFENFGSPCDWDPPIWSK